MKVRKLAVALALAGGLGSGVAQALGLGEIELQSYLNEPLDAEITLPQSRGINPADVFVNVASEQAYERVGLDRNQFLSKLRFEVIAGNDGRLTIDVSSREPLREPYLNFLLELTWPNGRLMREYAVLVDPPVYAEESGVQEQISAPAASTTEPAQQPSSTRSRESVRRQAQAEQSLSRGYQGNTFGPTDSSDTLWTIASRVRPNSSVSMQQVMLAIQDLNPNAFMGNNINRLKRGEVLRIPSIDQIQTRSRAEATRLVGQQNQEFQSPQRTVDATAAQQAEPAAPSTASSTGQPSAASGGDELKLVVSDDAGRESSEAGSAGGDGQLPGGADAGTAVALEELESARRENDELNSRVDDLQDQVETLRRLLELKNTQLAEIQEASSEVSRETADAGEGEMAGGEAEQAGDAGTAEDGTESMAGGEESVADATADEMTDTEMAADGEEMSAEDTDMAAEDTDMSAGDTDMSADDADAAADDPAVADSAGATDDSAMVGDKEESGDTAEEVAASAPAASEPAQPEEPAPEPAPEPEPEPETPAADKGFPANVIDAITGNPMYQIALGGGLVLLLLLLLLLSRRNANREKEFYEQLSSESDDGGDSFELNLDDEEPESAASNALEEADTYIAYGRYDQAAQALETAISREPSRTDLRLKLLGVYADTQDRDSFEKQFGEIEALEDESALAAANELRARLEEAESMPSIDDLESQLRSDSFSTAYDFEDSSDDVEAEKSRPESEELLADQFDSEKEEPTENEFGDFDTDFSDLDLDEFEEPKAEAPSASEQPGAEQSESRDDMIEYDLSSLELESTDEKPVSDDVSESEESGEWDMSSEFEMDLEESLEGEDALSDSEDDLTLDLGDTDLDESDLDDSALEEGDLEDAGLTEGVLPESDRAPQEKPVSEAESEGDLDSLDESFLDDLDAELDKVAGEEEELGGKEVEESSLDDLELDVSDEDLALMEEFSDSADSANPEEPVESSSDEELDLEGALGESDSEEADPEQTVGDAEELEQQGITDELEEDLDLPVASDEVSEGSKPSTADVDESELGDDDDFDFLAGTDEAATKLDLARAYIEMGDSDGARDILEEVALEGDESQKNEAKDLLKNLS